MDPIRQFHSDRAARSAERFWARVKKGGADDCWPFHGARNTWGYGMVVVENKHTTAHRRAFVLTLGEPVGRVKHTCGTKLCCNPKHLIDGRTREVDPFAAVREFERHVDRRPGLGPNGDCHEWTGCIRGGYGFFLVWRNGKRAAQRAHRAAWLFGGGELLKRQEPVSQVCGNKKCVRFSHLQKGASYFIRSGENHPGSSLTWEDVKDIRRRYDRSPRGIVSKLAKEKGVSPTTILDVVNEKSWCRSPDDTGLDRDKP